MCFARKNLRAINKIFIIIERRVARMSANLPLKSNKLTLATAKTSTKKLRIMELAPHISMRGQHGVKKSRPISRRYLRYAWSYVQILFFPTIFPT
jgi:hypothetical protein